MEKFWRNERAAGGENLIFKTTELERMFLADAHRENYRRRLREIVGRMRMQPERAQREMFTAGRIENIGTLRSVNTFPWKRLLVSNYQWKVDE